jgi:hypothetical protein
VQIGDIARAHGAALRASYALTEGQSRVLVALQRCRTAALGGHLYGCDRCGHQVPLYNSCRNRHCPTCQSLEAHQWITEREQRILPVGYFHVVFTIPDALRPWVHANPTVMFAILMRAAAATLLTLAADPAWLGAIPAITTVLHTWTRELLFHPHVHAIVSAGGLSSDGERWIPSRRRGRFLFPVRVLGTVFRAKFRDAMLDALATGSLAPPTALPDDALDRLRDAFRRRTRWNVYAKQPFGGAEAVYRYLSRYTHRVGISNARLRSMDDRGVTFVTKGGKTVTVSSVEFLRRFLDHVLPHGFTKIRHYGLLAPCHATTTLERARALIAPHSQLRSAESTAADSSLSPPESWVECLLALTGVDALRCPRCIEGRLAIRPLPLPPTPIARDTS